MSMRMRAALLSVVVAGWLASACGGMSDEITAPTSTPSSEGAGSQSSRDIPPPSPPQPLPPPVDRGPVPPRPPSPPATGTCDVTKVQWAIGEPASDDLLQRARVAARAGSARFLRPNQPITTELLASRLNLELDATDVVRSARCG